ncbi:hypothetical protein K438DRAFT_1769819 [Mycena galopus ATCC 62051]|nr:hypothetical protein K438DRAFT_1769819 [Mycena galopus ATCC 62051]
MTNTTSVPFPPLFDRTLESLWIFRFRSPALVPRTLLMHHAGTASPKQLLKLELRFFCLYILVGLPSNRKFNLRERVSVPVSAPSSLGLLTGHRGIFHRNYLCLLASGSYLSLNSKTPAALDFLSSNSHVYFWMGATRFAHSFGRQSDTHLSFFHHVGRKFLQYENPIWPSGPSTESHVLILEGGRGGAGGPGGIHASGDGGSGGTGEGPSPAVCKHLYSSTIALPLQGFFKDDSSSLDAMHEFFAKATETQHIYVLYGLGGAGKTDFGHGEADAIALLLKSAAQEISIANELLAAKIVKSEVIKVLWYLPLAIVQAGAFISESGAFDTYLLLYATNQATLLREKPVQSHDEYVWTVYTTWQMSFNQLSWPAAMFLQLYKSKDHPRKRQKLDLDSMRDWPEPPSQFASMDRTERAQEFLRNFLGSRGEWEPLRFLKLTNEIKAYSLINYDQSRNHFLSIHCQRWAHLDCNMPRIYRHAGHYTAAKALEEAVLKNQRTLLSDDHPDVLVAMHNLARTYRHLGQYTEAEKLQFALLDKQKTRLEAEKLQFVVLEKRRKLLGDDHPDTLTYDELGQTAEAEKLKVMVLEKRRKLLGDDHLDTLQAMRNLAITYDNLGLLKDAEKLKLVVLEKRRKFLGDDHLDTLWVMHSLASTYDNFGRFEEAEELKVMVLQKRRKLLGADHPDTLRQFKKAEQLQVVAVEKQRKLLGDNHPDTQLYMKNLAQTYRALDKQTEAEELEQCVMEEEVPDEEI